ncbi:MAG: MFS transporter [Burkholderiaceae bacterium]|nr:MAG: MFS transporter [Burkholderiaceae bacterium]
MAPHPEYPPSPKNTADRPQTVIVIAASMLTALVVIVFARLAYGLLLPSMRADLGLSYQQAGNLGTINALGYFLFILPGGAAAARWGARNAVIGGLLLVASGFIGLTVAHAYWVIAALMLALGIGTAYCFAPMLSLVATWFPERRGLMIGYMTAGIGAGLFLAGLLVPWLIALFGTVGWRVNWGLFAAAAGATAVLVLAGVRDPPVHPDTHLESSPAADRGRIYRNPRMIVIGMAYGVIGMSYIVQAIFAVSFAEASGIAGTTAGRLFAMSGLLAVVTGPLWGRLSDSWGRGNTLLLTVSLVTLAMAVPIVSQSLPAFFIHFLLFGCTVNGAFTMVQAASTDQVAERHIPIAVSYATLFFAGGQFLGPAVAGWLIENGGFKWAFGFTCITLLIGVALSQKIRAFPRKLAVS